MSSRSATEEPATITSTHDAVETAIDLSKDAGRGRSWEELSHSGRKLARWVVLGDKGVASPPPGNRSSQSK